MAIFVFVMKTSIFLGNKKQTTSAHLRTAGKTFSKNMNLQNAAPEKAIKDRTRYAKKVKGNILLEDILFSSPSGAAAFVCGYSISGNIAWKDGAGTPLKDLI